MEKIWEWFQGTGGTTFLLICFAILGIWYFLVTIKKKKLDDKNTINQLYSSFLKMYDLVKDNPVEDAALKGVYSIFKQNLLLIHRRSAGDWSRLYIELKEIEKDMEEKYYHIRSKSTTPKAWETEEMEQLAQMKEQAVINGQEFDALLKHFKKTTTVKAMRMLDSITAFYLKYKEGMFTQDQYHKVLKGLLDDGMD